MAVLIQITKSNEYVSLALDAVELVELKLECQIDCEPALSDAEGATYSHGLVRVLCIDGLRIARRKLRLDGGLRVSITRIAGSIKRSNESCVCHATSLAVARALEKDESSIVKFMDDWQVVS
jgi:hypothetical protein